MADLYVRATADGLNLELDGRMRPVMTAGLDSAVTLSILTPPWWGNLTEGARGRYDSLVPQALADVVTPQSMRSVASSVESALSWLIEIGAARSVDVAAEIASAGRVDLRVTVEEPNRERGTYVYGLNWRGQESAIEGGRL